MPTSPAMDLQTEETPAALQRLWNLTRARLAGTSTSLLDEPELVDTLPSAQEPVETPKSCLATASDYESDGEDLPELDIVEQHEATREGCCWHDATCARPLVLDAGRLGDVPAVYRVPHPAPHQLPVVGVYIDPRVRTGFRYKVRPMQTLDAPALAVKPRYLFSGRALTLQSIGRGYARRFTFECAGSTLNDNDNYFWSDSRPEGFAFELEAVSVGDKFTVYDANGEPQGTLCVEQLLKDQVELSQTIQPDGAIEKRVRVSALCRLEWYAEDGATKLLPVTGVAVVKKFRGKATAAVVKVVNVAIGIRQNRKGCELRPGIESSSRRLTVSGGDVGDVPCTYSILGLERYELPVIGTYVDPRIIPGFHYRVRAAGSRRHLFGGRSLLLQSVGIGYGKRLTFRPDSLNHPDNYFWSDSHPEGVGLETRALHTGMKFTISANGAHLGEASVFRADLPQVEEKTVVVDVAPAGGRGRGPAVDKYVHVDVTCHVKLATTGGGVVDSEVHLMKVSGVAHMRKSPGEPVARLLKVFNVGLDSQLNLLFAQSQTELTFHPLP